MTLRIGKPSWAVAATALAAGLCVEASVESAPILVRGSDNARVWQTDFSPEEPIEWYWGKATVAELSVTDYGKDRTVVHTVTRVPETTYGSFALALPADFAQGGERLYDLSLTLKQGETVLSTQTARIARVHDVDGQGVNVKASSDADWGTLSGSGILAYDAAWSAEPQGAAAFVVGGEPGRVVDLPGTSGYAPLNLRAEGSADVTLRFGETDYATAHLSRIVFGMVLIFR